MAETNVTTAPAGSAFTGRLQEMLRQGDMILALCVVSILLVLLLPIPPWLIDILLTTSIAFSILILLVSLFIKAPLDFSTYPTVLLMATLLRLALNLATTRLILSHGNEGTEAAGKVIRAFGTLVMSGNFLIGVIVFAILVIVNFVVITKGSGRIAEVAARFSLDGMPGKQMAIDADLSAGLIDEKGARERRAKLEGESSFFGAMDGASKFVRGDAVAGLLIVFINIVGGIVIGTFQHGLTITQAAQNYTLLTVGDGLVTQIPALIVSISAGMLVSKAGVQGAPEDALFGQLGGYPKALGMASALLTIMALVPGLPMLPFLLLGGMTGAAAYYINQSKSKAEEKKAEAAAAPPPPPTEEPISTALHIDVLRLELGYGLLPMINTEKGPKLTDQIKALRRQIAADMGFVMPSVRIQDNIQLQSNSYVIRVKEIVAGRGDLQPHQLLVMDPRGEPIQLPGTPTKEPTFGLPAMWVDEPHREEAIFKGYTVVDPPTVVTTHLTEVIKDNMAEMLSYSETQKLLDEAGKTHQKLIGEMVPSQISVGGIQRVLQNLLGERVSIRDLPTILEAIAEAVTHTRNLTAITEHVRSRLARQLCDTNTGADGVIALVTLSPEWEQAFAESIVGQGDDRQLSMAPSKLQDFIAKVRQTFERFAMMGENPILLTSPLIRPFVRSIVERFRPVTTVMSQNEIYPKSRIKTVGSI
ncbi:MAG TPA: flagellar biosynthesis protein FlhA [Alphaproteobacteria bacterium]|nr:flagellar biosynthesis protein FlhA [Alphaproteobacteria bacterium]